MNFNHKSLCSTVPYIPFMPVNPKLAKAYIPYQMKYLTYNKLSEGFHAGTIFPDLYSPYEGNVPKGGILCCEYFK